MKAESPDVLREEDGHWVPARNGLHLVWQPNPDLPTDPCPKCGVMVGGCRTSNGYLADYEHAGRRDT